MQAAILKERQIVDKAIDALSIYFPIPIEWENVDNSLSNEGNTKKPIDGFLILQNKRIPAEVKGDFRMHQLGRLLEQKAYYKDFILVANVLSDNIKNKLKEEGINYLDTAGNAFISYPPNIMIAIDGKKREANYEVLKDRAFTKTGMRLVFEYLKNGALINLPYRDIADIVGVSIDTIAKTNESLKQQGFIKQLTDKKKVLANGKILFEKWGNIYETSIKPKMLFEKFSFLNIEAERNWKTIPLSNNACWGGEAAADLQTNYIRPTIFTLYSTESKAQLMQQYRFKPNPNGNIHVYLPFTDIRLIRNESVGSINFPDGQSSYSNNDHFATHPILTYVDLINSGDARNIEVALKIYEKYVKFFF